MVSDLPQFLVIAYLLFTIRVCRLQAILCVSDGETLGGCQNSNSNKKDGQVKCNGSYKCVSANKAVLYGTCAKDGNSFPTNGFGTGQCRTGLLISFLSLSFYLIYILYFILSFILTF